MHQEVEHDMLTARLPASSLQRVLMWAQRLFTPLAFCAFVYVGWQARATFVDVLAQANSYYLAMALLVLLVVHILIPIITIFILQCCGISLTYPLVFSIHVRRLPARYLPGGIWHAVGRLGDLYAQGVRPSSLTIFAILENAISVSLAFILGGGGVWYLRRFDDIWGQLGCVSWISSVVILSLLPFILQTCFVKKNGKEFQLAFYLQSISMYLLLWIVMAFAFYLYCLSFSTVFASISFLDIAGVYLFSWGIGFLAIFSPQGIGVFEFLVGNMMHYDANIINISLIILGFRAVTFCADILIYTIFTINNIVFQRNI